MKSGAWPDRDHQPPGQWPCKRAARWRNHCLRPIDVPNLPRGQSPHKHLHHTRWRLCQQSPPRLRVAPAHQLAPPPRHESLVRGPPATSQIATHAKLALLEVDQPQLAPKRRTRLALISHPPQRRPPRWQRSSRRAHLFRRPNDNLRLRSNLVPSRAHARPKCRLLFCYRHHLHR